MAKSVGFIGNMQGKVGNVVGFKVSQSNSGTNQGVRVYQPNIKNPKSAAQAEQRAKYAPIFWTYNAIKNIVDRGNESKQYGNASRVAWLKRAFRSQYYPWFKKGVTVNAPIICEVSFGSLPSLSYGTTSDNVTIDCPGLEGIGDIYTIGELSDKLFTYYPWLHDGDQLTIVSIPMDGDAHGADIYSIILDREDDSDIVGWTQRNNYIEFNTFGAESAVAIIISRRGPHGEHLRSTEKFHYLGSMVHQSPYNAASKQTAIESYMAIGTTNADWAEESIE